MGTDSKFTSHRKFTFTDTRDGCGISVLIPETPQAAYGTYVWPCAPVLAQYLWYRRDVLQGLHVLELGAGTALPGIVAARCGAAVTLTDSSATAGPQQACQRSCEVNDLTEAAVMIIAMNWGEFSPQVRGITPPPEIILGSDCLYDSSDFEKVIATVYFFLSRNPAAVFWTTYQVRSDGARQLLSYLLERWDLRCVVIPLDSVSAAVQVRGDGREQAQAHDILLLEIGLGAGAAATDTQPGLDSSAAPHGRRLSD